MASICIGLVGGCERHEHADFGLLPVDHMGQIADHRDRDTPTALDRDNGLFGLLAIGLEINQAINATIRAFLLAPIGHRIDQRDRPPLELILILVCQRSGSRQIFRRAMHVILDAGEGIVEPLFNERNREVGNVDAYPLPAKLLRCVNRGATAAEGVEDNIAFIATGLVRIRSKRSQVFVWDILALFRHHIDRADIRPDILQGQSRHFIKISLELRDVSWLILDNTPLRNKFLHAFFAITPISRNPHNLIVRIAFCCAARASEIVEPIPSTIMNRGNDNTCLCILDHKAYRQY